VKRRGNSEKHPMMMTTTTKYRSIFFKIYQPSTTEESQTRNINNNTLYEVVKDKKTHRTNDKVELRAVGTSPKKGADIFHIDSVSLPFSD
jgi:hypothetical protein